MFGQSLKKTRSSKSSGNPSSSGSRSVSSPQSFWSSQPLKLGTSPLGSTFRGKTMTERCPNYKQFHTGTCGMPHVCFHYGPIDHVKRFCSLFSSFGSVGVFQSILGTCSGNWMVSCVIYSYSRSKEMSRTRAHRAQRSQVRAQTYIFAMTACEAQANLDTVTSIMVVFTSPARVLF